MNLLEDNLLWLIPYGLLLLVMVHAMMEFTVSLLVQRPTAKRKPIGAKKLLQRLLELSEPDRTHPLMQGKDCDLEIHWETEEAPRPRRFAVAKGAAVFHLRFLLDERRHELRMNLVTRSYFFFLGLVGWLPRFGGYFSVQAGPPGEAMTKEISQITTRNGWSVRPVLWWFQATHGGYRFLERVTPVALRRWSARRFWGILYPVSYALAMGYLVAVMGPLSRRDLLLLLGISALWWGIWGLLVWILRGFPAFWRRWRR